MKPITNEEDYLTEIEQIQDTFEPRAFKRSRPKSEFPELVITIPDSLNTVKLAPLYDVHIGSREHDSELFLRHRDWIGDNDDVFTWDGGDMFENITPGEGKMGHTPLSPEEQIIEATRLLAPIQNKFFFKVPGNHEARTMKGSGMSSGRRLADNLHLPYFPDYVFVQLKWRGNSFRILAHHGAGGAQTPGAQRNSARKELPWAKPDILWTGHLHQPIADIVYQTDYDQKTGRIFERNAVVMISPSYVRYFGGYAAAARMGPGPRGLSMIQLQEDGRIDVDLHARGRRL